MSFRELRSFIEKMRAIGYPGSLSMDSFRNPNFPLVANIMSWLIRAYDSNAEIPEDLSTEQDRIMFIKSVAQLMATKAHIRLNTKKLYMADGNTVRELLKIATVIHQAVLNCINDDDEEDSLLYAPPDITSKLSQLKVCRALASEITERGAILYDLLGQELELRGSRSSVLSRNIEMKTLESAVTESLTAVGLELENTQKAIDNLEADENNLNVKIDRKRQELDRAEKRLRSLEGVRPAYMGEYEKVEAELVKLYEQYVTKFCNLAYLERQLDDLDRLEAEKLKKTEARIKLMQTRLQEQEAGLLRGDGDVIDELAIEMGNNVGSKGPTSPLSNNGSYASPLSASSRAHRPKGAAPTRSARAPGGNGLPKSHDLDDEDASDEDELDVNTSEEAFNVQFPTNDKTRSLGTINTGMRGAGIYQDDGLSDEELDDEDDDLSDHDF